MRSNDVFLSTSNSQFRSFTSHLRQYSSLIIAIMTRPGSGFDVLSMIRVSPRYTPSVPPSDAGHRYVAALCRMNRLFKSVSRYQLSANPLRKSRLSSQEFLHTNASPLSALLTSFLLRQYYPLHSISMNARIFFRLKSTVC